MNDKLGHGRRRDDLDVNTWLSNIHWCQDGTASTAVGVDRHDQKIEKKGYTSYEV